LIVFSPTLFAVGPCFVPFLLFALGISDGRFSECVVFISFSSSAFLSCPLSRDITESMPISWSAISH